MRSQHIPKSRVRKQLYSRQVVIGSGRTNQHTKQPFKSPFCPLAREKNSMEGRPRCLRSKCHVEAGRRVEIRKGFPRSPLYAGLFDSFWAADSFTLPLLLLSVYISNPAHLDAMCVVHQAVEDSVGQCGISDLFMPARHRQLRSQDHRVRLVAILSDLPEVSSLLFRHRGHDPVIDDQNIDPIQPPQQLLQTVIGACQAQTPEQRRGPRVVDPIAIPSNFLPQCRSHITPAHTGRPSTKMCSWLATQAGS
jgi:hypothetical protein